MATAEVKETVFFLPQQVVQKSVGFSLDVGKTICSESYLISLRPVFSLKFSACNAQKIILSDVTHARFFLLNIGKLRKIENSEKWNFVI